MPIYEFYCRKCNTIYNFFSKSVNTERIPRCPRCKRVKLKRQMSLFAAITGERNDSDEDMPHLDESRMEKAMAMLAKDADNISEDDPRQAAAMVRKLSEAAGLDLSSAMEEALHRLEKGEDPEKIEEELGDVFENEDPFILRSAAKKREKHLPPRIDETLYDL